MLALRRRTNSSESHRRILGKDDDPFGISKHNFILKNLQLIYSSRSGNASVLWERKSSGYRIVDLPPDKFMEALRFIPNNYFYTEPLCRAMGLLEDNNSCRTYLRILSEKLILRHSICALSEGSGNIIGLVLLSLNSWQDFISHGIEVWLCNICTVEPLVKPSWGYTMKIEISGVATSSHQQKGVGTSLVRSCLAKAFELRIPAVIGYFTSGAAQTIADRLGFKTLMEVPYEFFRSTGYNEVLRGSFGSGNYSIAFMISVTRIPLPESPAPINSASTIVSKTKSKGSKKRK